MGPARALRRGLGIALALLSGLLSAADPLPPVAPAYRDHAEARALAQELAERHGFDAQALLRLLGEVHFNAEAAALAGPPSVPVQRSWRVYRSRFVEPQRIRAGVAFWREHAACLARAQRDYGVPEEVLVGLLGVETIYGRRMGRFPVLEVLATLAFDYPEAPNRPERAAMFRQELAAYLLWCRDTGQDAATFTGSYTGAIGIPQFLPSSIRAYAVDYDGDGRIDLTASAEDAIGSVAHYLKAQGWQRGRPILWPAASTQRSRTVLAARADGSPALQWRVGDLLDLGVLPPGTLSGRTRAARQAERETRAVLVDLPTPGRPTEYRIGLNNFCVITRYNRSFFYAVSVVELGQAVQRAAKRR